jgi:hypothetical protein
MGTWRFRARCIQPGRAGVAVGRAFLEGKLHYNQGQLLPREDMFFFFFLPNTRLMEVGSFQRTWTRWLPCGEWDIE